VYGGAVVCPRSVRAKIISTASLFGGVTPLPLPLVNAALTSVRILATDSSFLRRLQHNTQAVRTGLRAAGMSTPETPGPIVTLPPKAVRRSTTLSRHLLAAGIYPPFIRYPGGETKGCFRFVISSEHTPAQLANLVEALTGHTTP
jgi:7-keto-8-aminopelargonate synthetase-like enzyme